jgi:cytochrome c-type biogenesis protein CcmE
MSSPRIKFIVGGLLILAAVVYLIVSSTQASAQYFMTVDELNSRKASLLDQNIRISGAVMGETINYDPKTLTLTFMVANVTGDNNEIEKEGGLAVVLHNAVIDPNSAKLKIVYVGVKPDLMRDEAQAIMTGKLGSDGIFHADELLLKCPTKYEQAVPQQVSGS